MKEWLEETHGTTFELFRHFLRSFFDDEVITARGHMVTVLVAIVPI